MFSWQLSEIINKIFFKERKKHCYEKRSIVIRNVDQISIANLLTLLFYNFAKISVFQQGVSTVYSDNRLFYQSNHISLKVVNQLLLSFDNPWIAKTVTGQTWLIDIYAMLTQNVSFLECFWRSHFYIIRYCNKPTEITRNHFCDGFLENQNYLREMFLRRLRDVTEKTFLLRYVRDVLKTPHKRHLFWNVFETS